MATNPNLTCSIPYAVRVSLDLWRVAHEPLRDLAQRLKRQLYKPLVYVGRVEQFAELQQRAVEEERRNAREELKRIAPDLDAEGMWIEIGQAKTSIPLLRGLSDEVASVFVHATGWCSTREGVGTKRGYTLLKVARAMERDLEQVESWFKPIHFDAPCPVCNAPALATTRAATVTNPSRPTSIRCYACGHEDQVGRPTSGVSNLKTGLEPRLHCQCTHCMEVKHQVLLEAQEDGPYVLRALMARLVTLMDEPPEHVMNRPEPSVWHPYAEIPLEIHRQLMDRPEIPLEQVLRSYAEEKGGSGHTTVLADLVEQGLAAGWLVLTGMTPVNGRKPTARDIAKGLDLVTGGEDALGKFEEAFQSKNLTLILQLIDTVSWMLAPLMPYIFELRLELQPKKAQAKRHARTPQPALDDEPEPNWEEGVAWADRHERACDDLSAIIAMIDEQLGEGTARREPQLVTEMLRRLDAMD